MAGLNDILGSGEAIKKLIETVEKGVGRIYDDAIGPLAEVRRKKLLSAAETEIEHKRVIAQTETLLKADELAQRAGRRVVVREIRRQNNIDKVVSLASLNLEDKISSEPVSVDWATRFFEIAQDVNEENVQEIWAKILAGEIKHPGTFSLRTLETLRNITKEEARIFNQEICPLVFDDELIVKTATAGDLEKFGLPYSHILKMREAGLVNPADDVIQNYSHEKDYIEIDLRFREQMITFIKKEGVDFDLPILVLTAAGQELYKIQSFSKNDSYLEAIKNYFFSYGFALK